MNLFQTIESGKGLLKDRYEPSKENIITDVLSERRKKLKKTRLEMPEGRYVEAI